MAAAGEAVRRLLCGPVRQARVVHAVPRAVYLVVGDLPDGPPGAGPGPVGLPLDAAAVAEAAHAETVGAVAAGVAPVAEVAGAGALAVAPGAVALRAIRARGRTIALLGPGAVRVPIGIVLPDGPPRPAADGGTGGGGRAWPDVRVGDGAVMVDGVRRPIVRWWPTRVAPLPPSPMITEETFAMIERFFRDHEWVGGAVAERLGRGEGLTPEGDDELAGMLVALSALEGAAGAAGAATAARTGLATAVRAGLDRGPGVTTAVSAALLEAACDGHAIPQLARWLGDGCPEGTSSWRDLMAVGHTSGAALARGVRMITHIEEAVCT